METFSGKNLEDLLISVANSKECQVSDLKYEIIEEKKGVLGLNPSITIKAYAPSDITEFIFNYLGSFFTNMNIDVEIEIFELNDLLKVVVDTDKNSMVIGKAGRTLHAINNVLKTALNSEFNSRFNVLVDINSYKENRYRKLKDLAKKVATNVQTTKIDAVLDPMPNDERKIIHQFLTNFDHIKTESEGAGAQRHLVIKYK